MYFFFVFLSTVNGKKVPFFHSDTSKSNLFIFFTKAELGIRSTTSELHSVEITEIYYHLFPKKYVKSMFSLHATATVWKNEKFSLTEKNFVKLTI